MKKFFIKNRKGQRLALLIQKHPKQKGLAFVAHGLGGYKEQQHIRMFADAFFECSYTVIRFDATNAFGESSGNYENATSTNYYNDLEDVIKWSKSKNGLSNPFVLPGTALAE
ncbi:hypothetical protein C4569_00850 [Candidatus Parcubacteria bacterium]|nr:MAG: hypothetical protein C4569_00850 [Candidatus Parcubacteria bacterium]